MNHNFAETCDKIATDSWNDAKTNFQAAAKDFNEAAKEAKAKVTCVAKKAGSAIASAAKSAWEYCKENPMEVIHGALDIIGMIPGVGNIADGINAAIYLAEGDYVNAALSAISLIPMGGALAAVGKVAAKSDGLIKMVAKYGDEVVEGVARYGDEIVEGIARHGDEVVEGVARYGDEATDAARRCVNGQCFVAGTLVLTANGYKNIEDVEVGDKVIATDPETGETAIKEVKRVFENKTFELVHLTVNGETIVSTPGHKYYAPEKGWTSAIELCVGDLLQLVNGEYVVVEAVQHELLEEPVTIYNFEVEDFHTYYVGAQSVLVHNAGCGSTTEVELFSFGNATGPRGARPSDFNVDTLDDFVGPEALPTPHGASNAADVSVAPLSGHYHRLPAGTELPEGLAVVADGSDVIPDSLRFPGHHTIYPTRRMTVKEFNDLYLSLPWEYGGRKR